MKALQYTNETMEWTASVIVRGRRTYATVIDLQTGEVLEVSSRNLDTIHNAISHIVYHSRTNTPISKDF
jgi:hypothetical protein